MKISLLEYSIEISLLKLWIANLMFYFIKSKESTDFRQEDSRNRAFFILLFLMSSCLKHNPVKKTILRSRPGLFAGFGFAIYATYRGNAVVAGAEKGIDLLHIGNATVVGAYVLIAESAFGKCRRTCYMFLASPFEECENQRHAHKLAVLNLTEISGARVGINVNRDFVDTRQRVKHAQFGTCGLQFVGSKDKTVFQTIIFIFIKKTLLL